MTRDDPAKSGAAQSTAIEEARSTAQNQGLTQLPVRPVESHKGDYGRVVAIGGSLGMAGAIGLTGWAALRSGSGLVKILIPANIQSSVAMISPCLMTVGCPTDGICFGEEAKDIWLEHAQWADAVALGPGIGRADSLRVMASELYAQIRQTMVIDADGLNVLVEGKVDWSLHAGDRILTPHPGEFQRLIGREIAKRDELEFAAKELAGALRIVVVLKGHRTYVTDGSHEYRNDSGNPGMATAGSGDVLTGIVTSLVGQGLSVFEAAALGVHLHGIAGDFAAEAVGETSLIASDIVEYLPAAFKKHAHSSGPTIGFASN